MHLLGSNLVNSMDVTPPRSKTMEFEKIGWQQSREKPSPRKDFEQYLRMKGLSVTTNLSPEKPQLQRGDAITSYRDEMTAEKRRYNEQVELQEKRLFMSKQFNNNNYIRSDMDYNSYGSSGAPDYRDYPMF